MNRIVKQTCWIAGAMCAVSTLAPDWCGAQETVPQAPNLVAPTTSEDVNELHFTFRLKNVEIASLLKQMAEAANVKLFISDEVTAHPSFLNLTELSFERALSFIAQAANLSWGKIGNDTYLVTRIAPPIVQLNGTTPEPKKFPPNFLMPRAPESSKTPNFALPKNPQSDAPENWRPFDFNGRNYYLMPLTPTK